MNEIRKPIEAEKSRETGNREERLEQKAPDVSAYRKNQAKENAMFLDMRNRFGTFGLASAVYALFYTFCLYKNATGITYPFFVAGTLFYFCFCMKKSGVPFKKDAAFYLTSAALLGISVFLTADEKLLFLTKTGIFLLTVTFLLHQYYEDSKWSLPEYLIGIWELIVESLACLELPFSDMIRYFKRQDGSEKSNRIRYVLLGLIAAVPLLILVLFLLAGADAVFRDMIVTVISKMNIWNVFCILMMLFGAYLGSYCVIGALTRHRIPEAQKETKKYNAIPAVTALAVLTMVYMLFSGIQIFSLFLGKMQLPANYTWSSYAREGFFQLLAVCLFNLTLVLVCLWIFQENGALKVLLTAISLCTYVMIASSAFRMFLYVKYYHLTFLRVLVLWTLAVLAVLLAGVIVFIYRHDFPLFRYCLAVVTVCYVILAFARPDSLVASYNVNQAREKGDTDFILEDPYFYRSMSEDAVPILMQVDAYREIASGDSYQMRAWEYTFEKIREKDNHGRRFNLSVYWAKRALDSASDWD